MLDLEYKLSYGSDTQCSLNPEYMGFKRKNGLLSFVIYENINLLNCKIREKNLCPSKGLYSQLAFVLKVLDIPSAHFCLRIVVHGDSLSFVLFLFLIGG